MNHEKLKQARGDMSLSDVGKRVGVSPQQVWNIETGSRQPSAEVLLRLCLLYGLKLADVTRDEKILIAS
ncbi:MAG: helix-turn-helix transcriptional regulator [Acidobacteriota bacterium]